VKDVQLSTYNIQSAIEKEGLAIPAQVNYVGKGADLYQLGYEFDGSAEVITGYLRMTHSVGKDPRAGRRIWRVRAI
jgi:hypothetical protein